MRHGKHDGSREFARRPHVGEAVNLGLAAWFAASLALLSESAAAAFQHPAMVPTQLLVDSTPNPNGLFGQYVAAEGNWLAVSAHRDRDAFGNRNGTVTLFERGVSGQFTELQVLSSPGSLPDPYQSWFGLCLAMDAGRLLVSAPSEYRPDLINGVLYSFERDPAVGWILTQTITDPPLGHPPALGTDEFRGWRMDLHGDHLFVSFRHTNISGRIVYYHHDGNQWNYVSSIWPEPQLTGPVNFGWSLDADLDAGLLIVGANRYPEATIPGAPFACGRALVYRLIGNGQQPYQFQLDGDLLPPAPSEQGQFGEGCAVLGPDRVAVSTAGQQGGGHVYESYYEFVRGASGWMLDRRAGWAEVNRTTFLHVHEEVLYVGLPHYPAAERTGGAVPAYCLGEDFYNPAGVFWQTNSGGYFPRTQPAIGDDFVAVGVSSHFHTTIQAGAVEVYPRLTASNCIRATFGTSFCGGGATGCPTGAVGPEFDTGCVNSTGQGARMHYTGSAQGRFNTGHVVVTGLPPGEFALLSRGVLSLTGAQWNPGGHVALGSGVLCLVQPFNTAYAIRRVSPEGTVEWFDILEASPSSPSWGLYYSRWYDIPFQVLYRDRDAGGAATSNTSNALLLPIRLG